MKTKVLTDKSKSLFSSILNAGKAFSRYHPLLEEKEVKYVDTSTPSFELLLTKLHFFASSGAAADTDAASASSATASGAKGDDAVDVSHTSPPPRRISREEEEEEDAKKMKMEEEEDDAEQRQGHTGYSNTTMLFVLPTKLG